MPNLQRIPSHWKGIAHTLAGAPLLSPAGPFIKALDQGPCQINLYRSLIAVPTIILVLWLRHKPVHLDFTPAGLACGVRYAMVMVLFVAATKLTTAANAVLLQYSAPVFLLALEPWWFQLPFSRRDLLAVVACLAALVLFFTGHLERGNTLGNLTVVVMCLPFALPSLAVTPRQFLALVYLGVLVGYTLSGHQTPGADRTAASIEMH